MSISLDTVRVGKSYYVINYGERHNFEVISAVGGKDYRCKDLQTLEFFHLSELFAYGKGKDFEFFPLKD